MRKLLKDPRFLLVLIILLAGFLRLYRIDVLMRFVWDESRDMMAVRNIIVNRDITFFGPFNEIDGRTDFFGVFHYYLILPALWLANFDPVGPAIFTALLGTTAVALAYYWVSRWEDKSVALTVAAVLAVSPLAVDFNRWPWNPNTISFFAMLYLIVLYYFRKAAKKSRRKTVMIFIAGVLLGLLFQLHYFTIALAGSLIPIIYLERNKTTWLHLALFALGFILPNLTFVIFDLTHEGFYRKILFESFAGESKQKLVSVSLPLLIFAPIQYLAFITRELMASAILGIGVLLAWIVYAFKRTASFLKNRQYVEEVQLIFSWLLFLLIPILFSGVVDEYHSMGLWLSFAFAIVYAAKKLMGAYWSRFVLVLILGLLLSNNINREPTIMENAPRLAEVARAISDDAAASQYQNVNMASFIDSDTRSIRFRYFLENNGLDILGVDDYLSTDTLYVVSPSPWEVTRSQPAWELSNFREAEAEKIWQDEEWNLYRAQR